MLIKALCEYFEAQNRDEDLPDCLSEQKVHYMIFLTTEGTIAGITDIQKEEEVTQKNGKTKKVKNPVSIQLPKRSQKSAIDLNIIEHRPLYVFGLNYEQGVFTPEDKTEKAKKSHKCFADGNLAFCQELQSDMAKAYRAFLETWNPSEQTENPYLLALGKEYSTSYFCFALDGHPEIKLHEDQELLDKYIAEHTCENNPETAETSAVCPIEGKCLPAARIHDKIKGIKGGNSTGSVLVGIKNSAFESYGKTQSYNSNISEVAMKKYTAALNKLLNDKSHRIFIDDMTVVFFAISGNDENECDFFSMLLNGDAAERANSNLEAVANEILRGRAGDFKACSIDEDVTFYVVGLTPNSSRIAQKFVVCNHFGKIMANVIQHQRDMAVSEGGRQIPLWRIARELVSPKSSNQTIAPPLTSAMLYAILNGTKYPDSLLDTVIRRVKTDSDEENDRFIKMNHIRIGIMKACLNRKARLTNKKEEISMALDRNNITPAYRCGRLFAVLEYVQQNAANGKRNRTIKDAFFAAACARPATVFPRLLMLAQNHIAKLEHPGYWNSVIGDIMSSLCGEFPQTLALDDQGKFIIGYYQQNQDLYTPKSSSVEKANKENN